MKVGIHQPNYLPWIGYFAKIASADVFVFFDTVQMPMAKSFVSRNRVVTNAGSHWLTVPTVHGSPELLINETEIVPGVWQRKHLRTIEVAYCKSPYLAEVLTLLRDTFEKRHRYIADLNIALIEAIVNFLGIKGKTFMRSSEMNLRKSGKEQVLEILHHLGATGYVTGSGAGSMRTIDGAAFAEHAIEIEFVRNEFGPNSGPMYDGSCPYSIVDEILKYGPEEVARRLQ